MTVTIADVARAAGVSLSTVSRALSDSPVIKAETRLRIQRIAADMGYSPSAIARGLATKRTHKLGVLVLSLADPFVSELVSHMDQAAMEREYSLLLCTCGGDPQREMAGLELLHQQRVDAVVVADPAVPDKFLPLIQAGEPPVVLINKRHYPCSVATDNLVASSLAVEHLATLGHRRIAFIGSSRNRTESAERLDGYRLSLERAGHSFDPRLVRHEEGGCLGGEQGARFLLAQPCAPTAILCFDDLTAIGAMRAAAARGLRIPDDLSVMGVDDISLAPYTSPPLTTVAQDKEQLARLSVSMALTLAHGKGPVPGQILTPSLVVRGSTGPAPSA